jgi:prevent-host-death family protein
MRHVQSSEAKARFSDLLDQVEKGETIVITRHGKPIARIVPDATLRRANAEWAVKGIKELQKKNGPITVEEILSARDDGRK